jgi:peptide/nickel transport system substrate-binding protein
VPNSPGPLTTNTGSIAESRIVDPLTIHFVTRAPTPLLPNDLSGIPIINRRFAEAPTADFNSGAAAIGTGPYKLVSFTPGERIELARNDGYWGGQEPWEKVSLRLLTNASTRVTSLLAGDVDLIDSVPTAQIARLREDSRVGLFSVTSNRVINLMLDHAREPTPFAVDKASGQPLARNPLRDARVRQALSLAINRPALCERVMEGQAAPAGQVLPTASSAPSPAWRRLRSTRCGRAPSLRRPAIATASASRCTGPTTATSTIRRCSSQWRRCGPASASRPGSRRCPGQCSSPRPRATSSPSG